MEAAAIHRRILGVDYGSQRVGLSLSDPLGVIARPIEPLKNDPLLLPALQQLSAREHVRLVVIGMPFNLKGQLAQKADEVQIFIAALKEQLGLEVITWDERFTTTIAQQTMLAMGTKKMERRKKDGRIDSMAAAIILQGYLDHMNRTR